MKNYAIEIKALAIFVAVVLFFSFMPHLGMATDKASAVTAEGALLRERLTDNEKLLYDSLKRELVKIANGERNNAKITSRVFNGISFTKSQLGISELIKRSGNGVNTLNQNAIPNACKLLNLNYEKVKGALEYDLPYELFWYDKTAGSQIGINANVDFNAATLVLENVTAEFNVSADYSTTGKPFTLQADKKKLLAVKGVKDTANKVVSAANGKSDYEKLKYYKDYICGQVAYNEETYKKGSAVSYGSPWQLIYVFDNDPNTKVVCEGYTKAFKYLCDITDSFKTSGVRCHIVTGAMSGGTGAGSHMWNIVTMPNGKNYHVDITNCDDNTIGNSYRLFMRGFKPGEGGSNGNIAYTIDGQSIVYTYDTLTLTLYNGAGVLNLSDTNYNDVDAGKEGNTVNSVVKDYSAFVKLAKKQRVNGFSVKAKKKKRATLKWKPIIGATGYQIRYSTKKNFGKAKKKIVKGSNRKGITIKKLKVKKKYFFKIRPYFTTTNPSGKKVKVHGKWSSAKKVRIRK